MGLLLFKKRKLRSEILVFFLVLIAASSAITISYTYAQNSKSIQKFSQGTIDRVSALIMERTDCMLGSLQRLPEMGVGIFQRHPGISLENQELVDYFLEAVKYHPNIYAFYTGAPDGSALIVFNLALADKPFYFSDREHPVPAGTVYALILKEASGREVWFYVDENLKTISKEERVSTFYDPRSRPWFKGAVETGKIYWTGVFKYEPTGDLGIAVSKPVYNAKGELVSVIAADLSLHLFSEFLAHQPIGKAGKAFVLDGKGNIVIPSALGPTHDEQKTIGKVFSRYAKEHKDDFVFKEGRRKYLVSLRKFPKEMGKDWYLAVMDPITDYFSELIRTQREVVLISLIVLFIAGLAVVYFSKHISAPIVALAREVDKITRLDLESEARVSSHVEEISQMDSSIASMRVALRSFSRYVPKDVVKQLLDKGQDLTLGGEKKVITTLFSDITDFTPIAEELPIETVTELLAETFEAVTIAVQEERGTVDKFIGDCVMAFWGAPNEVPDQAAHACRAVLKAQARLEKMNLRRKEKKIPEFHSRMGLETGAVYVGNFGTRERMNYTVLGDPVNSAFRLEQINKIYHTRVLASDEVMRQAGPLFAARFLDIVEVKGKKKKIKIFELAGLAKADPEIGASPEKIAFCAAFSKAAESYHQRDFSEAKKQFLVLAQKYPDDHPIRIYLERLKDQ